MRSSCFNAASHQQGDDLLHHFLERLYVLGLGALRVSGWRQKRTGLTFTMSLQGWCVPIRAEERREKLAHYRNWTPLFQHELRQSRHLMNAPATAHSLQRGDRLGQLHRQDNRPLARIVASCGRTLAGEQFDIHQCSLTGEGLPDVHTSLAHKTDRAVTDQMSDEACKGQSTGSFVLVGKPERHAA